MGQTIKHKADTFECMSDKHKLGDPKKNQIIKQKAGNKTYVRQSNRGQTI